MDPKLQQLNILYKNLCGDISSLKISNEDSYLLYSLLQQIHQAADELIFYDPITGAMNLRAERWFINPEQVKAVAKIDLYDMRQANRVYGHDLVDKELHRLAYILRSTFEERAGYYVRRCAGSDEFKITSINKSEKDLYKALAHLQLKDQVESIIQWDFGVGENYQKAEKELIELRKRTRPQIIRQTFLDSHSEIPRYSLNAEKEIGRHDFSHTYKRVRPTRDDYGSVTKKRNQPNWLITLPKISFPVL